jgi:cytochrome c553
MNKRLGTLVLLSLALPFFPRALAQQQQPAEPQSTETGIPWAYGFATPATAAATEPARGGGPGGAPGAGGGGRGGRGGAAEDLDVPKQLPGSTLTFTLRQINNNTAPADWFPQDHPPMPEVVAHGRRPGVNACAFCHGPNGNGRPNNANLAGLPANYLLQQLEDFASGARTSWDKRKRTTTQMVDFAKHLTPEDARAAAEYYASLKATPWIKVVETDMVPKTRIVAAGGGLTLALEGAEAGTEPLGMRIVETPVDAEQTEPLRNPRSGFIAYVPRGSIAKGRELALRGGGGKTVACAACHGEGLKGTDTFPPLAGRSPGYLARQLYDFQHFTRVGPGSALMQPIVQHLSEEDILELVAYVGSLQP